MQTNNIGKIIKESNGYKVVHERLLQHDKMTVWDAITNPVKMAVWFTDVEMDFVPGGRMVIRFRDEAKTESFGYITRIETGKLFEFVWENTDGPDELATWELFDEGPSETKLIMTYGRLSDDNAISVSAGWHVVLDHLQRALDGDTEPHAFGAGQTEENRKAIAQYTEVWNAII